MGVGGEKKGNGNKRGKGGGGYVKVKVRHGKALKYVHDWQAESCLQLHHDHHFFAVKEEKNAHIHITHMGIK